MTKKYLISLMIVSIIIVNLGCLSAQEWDNVKSYDDKTDTYTITNALGLGEELAKIQLLSEHNQLVPRGYQKVAEFKIWNFKSDYGNAFQDMNFYQASSLDKKLTREFDYKYLTYESVKEIIYETSCEEKYNKDNETNYTDCTTEEVGFKWVDKEKWIKFSDINELPPNEEVVIGIFTDVQKGDYVEWIPKIMGEELEEWATWTESLNVDILAYYKFDETSGAVIDSVGTQNGTNIGATTGVEGKIGNCYDFNREDGDRVNLTGLTSTADAISFSFWLKPFDLDAQNVVFQAFTDSNNKLTINRYTVGWVGLAINNDNLTSLANNTWQHFVLVANKGTNRYLGYRNGVLEVNASVNDDDTAIGGAVAIGHERNGNGDAEFDGLIDEFGIWEREITSAEVSDLYNGGNGITYTLDFNSAPDVTLNLPIDNYNTTSSSVTFNCTASDDINLINVSLYIDGVINETNSSGINNSNYIFTINDFSDGSHNWTCEATDNESQTTTASYRDFNVNTTPFIEFIAPTYADGTNLTTTEIPAYVNLTETYFENLTIYLYNDAGLNQSQTFTDATRNYNFTSCTCANWYLNATTCTTTGQCNSTETRTYIIDFTTPTIDLEYPINDTTYTDDYTNTSTTTIDLNWSSADTHLDTCWYYNGTANTTLASCNDNATLTLDYGTYTLYVYANDTFGNEASESVTFTLDYNVLENSNSYTTPVVEGENNKFQINISYDSSNYLASGNLIYNGTSYAGTTSGSGDTILLYRNITAPSVSGDTNYTFYWDVGLTNSTGTYNFNSSTFTQLVEEINMSETGSPHATPFINFTAYDEQTLEEMNATLDLTITYKFQGGDVSDTFSYSDTSENNSAWSFALNPSDETYIIDAIIEVDATNYTQKFYNFEGIVINNTTTIRNFYLLPDGDSTTFIVSVKDDSYIPLVGVEVYIQRYYPSTNSWNTMEISETNDAGETTQHFFTEDAIYRFKIYNDGVLLHTTESTQIYCGETPCSVEIIVPEDWEDVISQFEDLDSLTTSLIYNEDTQDITYTYTDTSGDFTEGRLYVTSLTFGNSTIVNVCNTTSSSSTSILTCDLTGELNGTYIASGYITRDEETLAERKTFSKILSIVENVGLDGVLWSLFILVGIMMLGVYRPSLGIIFGSIGVILLSMLQIISIPITAIVSIIGIAIILLIGVNKQ